MREPLRYDDPDKKYNCDDTAMVIACYERDTGELRLCNKEKCAQPLIGRDATDRERENGTKTYFLSERSSRTGEPVTTPRKQDSLVVLVFVDDIDQSHCVLVGPSKVFQRLLRAGSSGLSFARVRAERLFT